MLFEAGCDGAHGDADAWEVKKFELLDLGGAKMLSDSGLAGLV